MYEYLGRTGYFTPILHRRQWGNIKWKASWKRHQSDDYHI